MDQSWLVFTQLQSTTKTPQFRVNSRAGAVLGTINFFPRWRKFVFRPHKDTVFDNGCLMEIVEFMTIQDARRKEEQRESKTDSDNAQHSS